MEKTVVIWSKQNKEKKFRAAELFLISAAAGGFLLFFRSLEGLHFQLWLCLPPVLLCPWILARIGRMERKRRRLAAGCAGAAACLLPVLVPALREQLRMVLEQLRGRPGTGAAADGAVLYLSLLFAALVFLLEIRAGLHWPLYVLTTAYLLLAPFLGIFPGMATVFLFCIFQISFWVLQGGPRLSMAGLLSLLFAAALLLVQLNPEWFYQAAFAAEGYVQRTVKRMQGSPVQVNDGTVSRGNLYPTGEEKLEISSATRPEETVYLKSFSGGAYENGVWQPAQEEEVYKRMEDNTLHWGEYESWIPGMLENMYFMLSLDIRWEEVQHAPALQIRNLDSSDDNTYVPYLSMRGRMTNLGEGVSLYFYQPRSEMEVDWDAIPESYRMYAEWYREAQQAYEKEIQQEYTRVPEAGTERLSSLCRENPLESLEEITAFILQILGEMHYTRTPGLFPLNQDPAEYFLFEGREGYCQHFASAAVLIYRFYGIPARYAAGYAVPASDFEQEADGSWSASVTDEEAHAWPEIFMEDYGWMPVEVSPSGDGGTPSYAGLDLSLLEQFSKPGRFRTGALSAQPAEAAPTKAFSGAGDGGTADFLILAELFLLGLVVLAALLFLKGEFQRPAVSHMDAREIFTLLRQALRAAGKLKKAGGDGREFLMCPDEAVPGLDGKEVENLLEIVREEAYSGHSAEKGKEARMLYRKAVKALYEKLPFWKKIYFRWKGFL